MANWHCDIVPGSHNELSVSPNTQNDAATCTYEVWLLQRRLIEGLLRPYNIVIHFYQLTVTKKTG